MIIWIEQDSTPLTVRAASPATVLDLEGGFDGRVEWMDEIETWVDLAAEPREGLVVEPVDVLFLVDWLLDAVPTAVTPRLAATGLPTREDPSLQSVTGEMGDAASKIRVCAFHTCGHGDYRAQVLEHLLTSRCWSESEAQRLLVGDLPLYRICNRRIPTVVVDRGYSPFGTVIAFSADITFAPMMMPATHLPW